MDCKDIMYHEYNNCDEQWSIMMNWFMYLKCNESNEK